MSSLGQTANTKMNQAFLGHKKAQDEQVMIKARIVKLRKEQEKA